MKQCLNSFRNVRHVFFWTWFLLLFLLLFLLFLLSLWNNTNFYRRLDLSCDEALQEFVKCWDTSSVDLNDLISHQPGTKSEHVRRKCQICHIVKVFQDIMKYHEISWNQPHSHHNTKKTSQGRAIPDPQLLRCKSPPLMCRAAKGPRCHPGSVEITEITLKKKIYIYTVYIYIYWNILKYWKDLGRKRKPHPSMKSQTHKDKSQGYCKVWKTHLSSAFWFLPQGELVIGSNQWRIYCCHTCATVSVAEIRPLRLNLEQGVNLDVS